MKRISLLVGVFSTSLCGQDFNFALVNNSDRPIHVIADGANDLFGLVDMQPHQPVIQTIMPGQLLKKKLSLTGILHKGPQIFFFPQPEGLQQAVPVDITLPTDQNPQGETLHFNMQVGAERVYELTQQEKFIALEVVPGKDPYDVEGEQKYYTGLTVQIPTQYRSNPQFAQASDIKAGVPFIRLSSWATHPENHQRYREFQAATYAFVYDYLRAGAILNFLWKHGLEGAKRAYAVWRMKNEMDRELDVDFSQGADLSVYERALRYFTGKNAEAGAPQSS